MIDVNDIIKFSDYADISLVRKDYLTYKSKVKHYKLKGDKVEKYISPIFYDLYQPNRVSRLLDSLKDINDLFILKDLETEFLNTISKLYSLGIVKVLDFKDMKTKNELCINGNEKYQIKGKKIKDDTKYMKLTILNFLNLNDIKPLIIELLSMAFNNIKIINIIPDILNSEKDIVYNIEDEKIKNHFIKYSDIKNWNEEILEDEILLTLNSALNVDLNVMINEYCIQYKIPWINCLVNDINIEIGPLVVYNKTSCYECYRYINGIKGLVTDDNEGDFKLPIKAYDISRRANLFIAFGYILDEISKFMYLDNSYGLPLTSDAVLSIKGSNLDYMIKDILKVPNCRICGL